MTQTLLLSIGLALLLQFGLWVHSVRTTNAGWVDFGWSAGMFMSGGVLLATTPMNGRVLAAGLLLCGWAGRLAWHVLSDRLLKGKPEDARYQALRAHWGDRATPHFLWFFLSQALLVGVFVLPALAVTRRTGPFPDAWDLLGLLLAVGAIGGESLSDRQLAAFRADPSTQGQVCRRGFWRYTRHPNYFFEWLHWFGYVMMGIGSPLWILTWIGPVLMYLFLRYLTGVPHAERQSLKSRGDAYRQYQQTTPVFFPWKPRAS